MKKLLLAVTLLLVGALATTSTQAQVAEFDQAPRAAYSVTSHGRVNLRKVHVDGNDHFIIGEWSDDITFYGWTPEPEVFYRGAYGPGQFFFVVASTSALPALRGFTSFGVEPDSEAHLNDIAVHGDNIYALGSFSGILNVGDGGDRWETIESLGETDLFLIHWNLKGTLQSVNRLGSEGGDFGNKLAIDANGNLLVAGRVNGTTNFLFDPADNWISPITSEGMDLFVARYSPELGDGSILDLTIMGGPEDQFEVTGLLVDPNNDVYVRGQFTKAVRVREAISNGRPGEQTATTAGGKQVFFTRLNQNLAPRWISVLAANEELTSEGDMDLDPSSQQLLALQDVSREPSYQGQALRTAPQGKDAYVLRVDGTNGNLINHFLIGTADTEDGKQIVSDGQGNYFVSGTFQSELTISQGGTTRTLSRNGGKNTFLAAFSTSGSDQPDDRLVYLSGFSNAENLYASRGMTISNEGSELEVHLPFVFDREAFGLDGASLRPNSSGTYDIFMGRYRFPSIPRITEVVPVRKGDRYALGARGIRLFSSSDDDFTYRVGDGNQALAGEINGTIDGSDQVYEVELPVPDTWVAGTAYPLVLGKSIYTGFYQSTVSIPPIVTALAADASGTCTETFSLSGRYFGSASTGVKVFFDRDGAEVSSATVSAVAPAQLQVSVPGVYTNTYQVRVNVNGQEATAGNFRVLPAITQLSSATVLPGATLTVQGCAFVDATHGTDLLSVNLRQEGQAPIAVTTFTVAPEQPNQLQLTLPDPLPVGSYAVEVIVNGQVAAGNLSLEVIDANTTQPLITALLSDGEASPGETVTITGQNLGSDPNQITVEIIEGQPLPVSTVNEAGTEITFTIPTDLPPGVYPKVIVKLGTQLAVGTLSLQVIAPEAPPQEPTVTLTPDAENPPVYDPSAEPLTLGVQVAGVADTDEVLLTITGLSGGTPQETVTLLQAEKYQASLTAEQLSDPLGFEYQFVVKNETTTRAASDPVRVYRRYPAQSMTLYKADQAVPAEKDYQLVAIPFRAQDVREAWTGPASFSADSIRLLRHTPGAAEYQEYGSGFSQFEPGRGYWLLKRTGVPLSVQGTAVEVDSASNFAIPLQAGWNLIGNPFPFEVGRGWLGDRDQRVFRSDRYTEATGTLKPYEGLFVESDEATTLLVSAVNDRNARTSAEVPGISRFENHPLDGDAWFVGFTLTNGLVTNQLAGFGMHPEARDDDDTYDASPLPRFKQFIEVQFSNPLGSRVLERSVVSTDDQYTWQFAVETDPSAREVRLAWNNQGWGRNHRELWLRDEATQQLIDLREVAEYTFRPDQQRREFTLLYGSEVALADQLLSERVQVGVAYPNPARDEVALSVTIPATKVDLLASFTLIDATGRIVRHGLQQFAPGYHTLSWERHDDDQRHLPSGVYYYRIRVGTSGKPFTGKLLYHE